MGEAMDMDEFVAAMLPPDVKHIGVERVDVAYLTGDDERALLSLYQGPEVLHVRFRIEDGKLVMTTDKETWL